MRGELGEVQSQAPLYLAKLRIGPGCLATVSVSIDNEVSRSGPESGERQILRLGIRSECPPRIHLAYLIVASRKQSALQLGKQVKRNDLECRSLAFSSSPCARGVASGQERVGGGVES